MAPAGVRSTHNKYPGPGEKDQQLGLSRSLSSAALYGTSDVLQIPISSLTEEFIVSRTWEAWQYRESRDPKVAATGIQVRTGRK